VHDIGQFVDTALATSKLNGQEWLTDLALLAFRQGKQLEYDDHNPHIPPQVIIRDTPTGRWLAIEAEADPDLIASTIEHFDSQYAAMLPEIENPGRDGEEDGHMYDEWDESLPHRIVDVILDGLDPDEFAQDFAKDQDRVGGKPFDPQPQGQQILRAVQFDTGHKLFVWRTNKRREHYGYGPKSFYLGYRFVAPDGSILFSGDTYHPGAMKDPLGDESLLGIVQSLCMSPEEHEDEFFTDYTPEQLEWTRSPAREQIDMDVPGHDGFEEGYPPPWRDLPGYEYTPQEA